MALAHFAEVRPPQGSMGGRGIKNLLGRPAELSQIEILVRETVQNVWDARIDGQMPSCQFDVRNIGRSQLEKLLGESMKRPELACFSQTWTCTAVALLRQCRVQQIPKDLCHFLPFWSCMVVAVH